MTKSQGFVSSVSEDGWADVVFHTSDPGIPGAPDVKVCHCSGSSAKISIKALDKVGSAVGDLVSVSRPPGAVMKSATTLLGIPVIGLVCGIFAGVFLTQQMGVHESAALIAAAVGLAVAIMIAVPQYRRMSANNQLTPIITSIIRKSAYTPLSSSMAIDPVCKMQVDPGAAAASVAYHGKPYYFCNLGCREAFVKEPAKYL